MHKTLLAFDKVPQLAKTDVAYATGDSRLQAFYQYTPALESIQQAIADRQGRQYPRQDLVQALRQQYAHLPDREPVSRNIESLADAETFTVVTAHQPSLLLGPLYFLYKALTTINLAEQASAVSGKNIVPVFVLGSEDHDIEELNNIHFFKKKLVWTPAEKGPVGSMAAESLAPVWEELKIILGDSEAAQALYQRLQETSLGAADIAGVTQALLHELFGVYGLVVLNMNTPVLKCHFIPVLKAEVLEQTAHKLVQESIGQLQELGFKTQATPREINLFYMMPGLRERIVLEDGVYKVLNTSYVFSRDGMLEEIDTYPERFSPNVVLRPLYQEMILPNLAYVGGGGELAYWLERKTLFAHYQTPFPMLLRRNSVLWVDRDSVKKLLKFGFSSTRFFDDTDALVRAFVSANADAEVSLEAEIGELHKIFDRITDKARAIDQTLEKAVRADEVKTVSGLEQWQGRLIRAEKQKHEISLNQIRALKEKLFPGNGLQERHDNFIPFLLKYGDRFVEELKAHLDPFDKGFVVLEDLG